MIGIQQRQRIERIRREREAEQALLAERGKAGFERGIRVKLGPSGRERFPQHAEREGVVKGKRRGLAVFKIMWDGRKSIDYVAGRFLERA